MEPYTHYLMWMRSRHDIVMSSTHDNFINSSSWEEEALADGEATGNVLGGFVWPPRSYFCSFCKREFRSAQALGGHMNVHRRDRAKLKQSLITSPLTTTQALHHDQNHHTSSTTSIAVPPAPPYSFHFSPPKLFSVSRAKKEDSILLNHQVNCIVDKKLSFDIDSDKDIIRCKRHKKTAFSLSKDNLLKNPCLIIDKHGFQSEKFRSNDKIGPIMEDIDLELRLGHPSTVK